MPKRSTRWTQVNHINSRPINAVRISHETFVAIDTLILLCHEIGSSSKIISKVFSGNIGDDAIIFFMDQPFASPNYSTLHESI